MSCSTSVAPASRACARFSRLPVERSSTTVTSSPRASRASTRLEPMNPAPPVTNVLIRSPILEGSARGGRPGSAERPCYPRRPMRLIVTEKNNCAKKIAEILGRGGVSADRTFRVPFYTWSDADGDHMTIGLKGHVLGPAFPEGYSNWQKTDLHDLIDAELIKEPTDKNVVKAIKKVARGADELVIATDFDREGELIGLEALEEMLDANPELGSREGTADGHAADQARPLLGPDQGGDRARLLQPRRALLPARQRRRRAPGHRPALGRDADPRRLPRQPPLRLQLPLGRPRAEPDPGPDRRARDGAPRPRRQTVLGAVRQVRAPRWDLRDPSQRRQVLGQG